MQSCVPAQAAAVLHAVPQGVILLFLEAFTAASAPQRGDDCTMLPPSSLGGDYLWGILSLQMSTVETNVTAFNLGILILLLESC